MRMRSGRMSPMRRLWPAVLACTVTATVTAQQSPVSSSRVQIDLGVSTRAAKSQDAAAQNARQVDAVLAAARKAAGPNAVLKTVSYSLNPNYQYHPTGGE